jgi:hypothetical protein
MAVGNFHLAKAERVRTVTTIQHQCQQKYDEETTRDIIAHSGAFPANGAIPAGIYP